MPEEQSPKLTYDQRLARIFVRRLVKTPLRPNHVTALTLVLTLGAGCLFALGQKSFDNWAVVLFVLGRFLDNFDGELARLQGTTSRFGYYFDYVAGGTGYTALFVGLGIGHWQGDLGNWAILLGSAGAISAIISLFSNIGIDRHSEEIGEDEAIGYPGRAGFDLEDGIYLIVPITWFGFLTPFFVAAGIGATIYCIWTIGQYLRLQPQKSLKKISKLNEEENREQRGSKRGGDD